MQQLSHLPSRSEILVLNRIPHGESLVASSVLSPDWGLITLYWRTRKSTQGYLFPDLFDHAECTIQFKQSEKHAFGVDYHLLNRPEQIASRYPVFLEATRWASFLILNTHHCADPSHVFSLARKVFKAFEKGIRPDITFVKAVFQLAVDEGYPVREEWLPNLFTERRRAVLELLRTPLAQNRIDPLLVLEIKQELLQYLFCTADFIIDTPR